MKSRPRDRATRSKHRRTVSGISVSERLKARMLVARGVLRLARRDGVGACHDLYSALRIDDRPARWWYLVGRAEEQRGRWKRAARAYGLAVIRRPRVVGWMRRRARAHERAGQRLRAAAAYVQLARQDDEPQWYYRAGVLLDKARKRAEAATVFAKALDGDPAAGPVDRQLLALSTQELPPRQTMTRFVSSQLPALRERVSSSAVPGGSVPRRIFVYWAQGWDAAPPVVRRCQEQLRATHSAAEIVALDDATVPDWVDVPASVRSTLSTNRTELSNVIRLQLLAEHGGVWLDATCFPTGNVLDALQTPAGSGFFAFTRRTARPSNWLLAASPHHYLVQMLLAGHLAFWQEFNRPSHYFMFHHMFESLFLVDEDFRRRWEQVPDVSAGPPHFFQRSMRREYDDNRFHELLASSFVHKLTYKYAPEVTERSSMLRVLLDTDAASIRATAAT
jgi:tetratricopeptide (TPR) repeat protein